MNTQEIMDRFFYRKSPFAIKITHSYIPVVKNGQYKEVTLCDIQGHIDGRHVIGAYQSRPDETCMWACIDFDEQTYENIATDIFNDYKDEPLIKDCMLETSTSKGYHVWFFFDKPMKTVDAYKFLISVLKAYNLSPGKTNHIDIFPRSPHLSGKRVGWMVRIPNKF